MRIKNKAGSLRRAYRKTSDEVFDWVVKTLPINEQWKMEHLNPVAFLPSGYMSLTCFLVSLKSVEFNNFRLASEALCAGLLFEQIAVKSWGWRDRIKKKQESAPQCILG